MTPSTIALIIIAAIPALEVLWYCLCSITEMTPETPHGTRAAVILIATGTFAELVSMIDGRTPEATDILLLAGLMVLVRSNCKRGVCPCLAFPTWPDRRREPR